MRRGRGMDWRLLAAWLVTAGALAAFLVLTKLGHAVAGNLIGVLTAVAAVYGTYLQYLRWRAGRPPSLEPPDPSGLVVLCHTRADLRWALWLEGRLDADGFSARLRRLPTGEEVAAVAAWAEQVAADCACVLVLATSELERAGQAALARVRALAQRPEIGGGRLILLGVAADVGLPRVPEAKVVSIAGIRREQEAWSEIREAVRECGARSTERRAASFGDAGAVFPGLGAARANLPAANPNFVGRQAELRMLRDELVTREGGVERRCVVLHAMSGMGKTQIAIEFVHALGDFDTVWWIHANQSAAIAQDLSDLAQELRLPEVADQTELRRLLWERLRTLDRWLLVYDNAESEEKLRDLLPPAGDGSILITSQSPNWSALARRRIALEHMSQDDAVALLRRRLPAREDQALAQIAEQLGWLPLALEQAASYMRGTQCPPGRYLRQLSRRFSETLELGTQAYYDRSAGTTYRMARELVAAAEPLSGLLMELCGFFSPEAIPRDLFEAPGQSAVLPAQLAAAVEAGLPYDTAVFAARRLSLLTVTTGSFSMHRVVQKLIRDSLTPPLRRERSDTAVRMLARLFPDDPDDVGTWESCGALLSHCVTALREVAEHDLVSPASTRLSRLVGEYQRARGAFEPALEQLNTTLAQLRLHGGEDSELAATELALARVHFRLADLPEAKEHALTALGLHESAAQPDHQRTAANLLDLSQIRLELSEFDEALGDAQRSLAIRQSAAGACPELSGLSLEALGCVQWRLGAWPQARESLEQSLALLEAAFGDGNGVCARVRTLYGLVLRDASLGDLGQLAQAESMLRRAHLVLTRGHGADHPDTVSAEIHLADTRRRMAVARRRRDGDQQDFERACGQVARRYEQVMGRLPMQAKKPGRACALVRYGHVLNNLGRNEQARALVQEARGIYIQGCGADHPYVAEALTRLIGIEQDLGNPSGARHAAHEARRIYVWRYGPQHPYVHQIDAFLADPEHGGRD